MTKQHILVIDDDHTCCDIIDLYLSNMGYDVHCVHNAQDGLHYIENHKQEVALILLDLMMPGMSGNEFLKIIKNKTDELANIPVIVQSGSHDEEFKEARANGASMMIQKPFVMEKMLTCIKNTLSSPGCTKQAAS